MKFFQKELIKFRTSIVNFSSTSKEFYSSEVEEDDKRRYPGKYLIIDSESKRS